MRIWVALALAGCGRFNFDTPSTTDDAMTPFDMIIDTPVDGAPVTITFGETENAMVHEVTQDTSLQEPTPNFNFGGAAVIEVDGGGAGVEKHGLLRFDITSIHTTATVIAAELRVDVSDPSVDAVLTAVPVLEPWLEGEAIGADAVANWNNRIAFTSWAGNGATGASVGTTIVATRGPGIEMGSLVLPLDVTTVQMWVANPDSNNGLAFSCSSADGYHLASKDIGEPSRRPELAITISN